MIKNIQKISTNKFSLLVMFVLAVVLMVATYFLGFHFGPDLADSTRVSLRNTPSSEYVQEIVSKFEISKVVNLNNDNENQNAMYELYLLNDEVSQLDEIKAELELSEELEYTVLDVSTKEVLNIKTVIVFLLSLNAFAFVAIWLISRGSIGSKNGFFWWLLSTDIFYFSVVVYAGLISILSSFGWQVTTFTLNSVVIGLFSAVFLGLFLFVEVKNEIGADKDFNLSTALLNYIETKLVGNIKLLGLFSLFALPFAGVYDFSVEIILIVIMIWISYFALIIAGPAELAMFEKLSSKKKNSKSKKSKKKK